MPWSQFPWLAAFEVAAVSLGLPSHGSRRSSEGWRIRDFKNLNFGFPQSSQIRETRSTKPAYRPSQIPGWLVGRTSVQKERPGDRVPQRAGQAPVEGAYVSPA